VMQRIIDGNVAGIGDLVDESQHLAEQALANQVPETVWLARRARELGAAAASAFGAGFGGSVWALVRRVEAGALLAAWRESYAAQFPARRVGARFTATCPGEGVFQIPTGVAGT
jgi:galactokinase